MKIKMDQYQLEAAAKWQRERYDETFIRVIDTYERIVDELKRLRAKGFDYDEKLGVFDATARSAQVVSILHQALTNSQVYQMVSAAQDLDVTNYALLAIKDLRQEMPPEWVAAWGLVERNREMARIEKEQRQAAAEAEQDRTQCHFKKREARCPATGKVEVQGKLYCTRHSKDPNVGKKFYTV